MYHRVYYTSLYCLHIFIYQELQKKNKTKQKNPELFLTSRALYASVKLISSIKMSQKWTLSFPKTAPEFDQNWVHFTFYSHVPRYLYISGSV